MLGPYTSYMKNHIKMVIAYLNNVTLKHNALKSTFLSTNNKYCNTQYV